ncbi:hypothetical protein TCAL_08981 [Tigriopus californicus]|uniref:Ferritin n=1 Tax=Tigriopus californicus TaxID=6832 RepID=A0A553PL46_TIGCA|nr:soma ferritin-like [Tigriopus californicus]TRY78395.1 hypothetical protein TCAL_08981 [Tigriopus californicus]|eukprot:TCALIF_08981-PA protein Name:"Similar to Soma ferritin (Lymnaea stagnalis)" AED:0.08 eAED:0.08 QI:241/1/1/1/1/1/3/12/172
MATSVVRQNYHTDSEASINKQINMELYASYTYTAMYAYFSRDDVALHGFAKFFRKNADEERDHAFKLIEYQNMRGGRVAFQDIGKPNKVTYESALEAVQAALTLEKTVNQSLLDLHKMADSHGDPQLTDFLEGEYLEEQVEAIKELGDLVTKVKRAGDGIGIHIIDKEMGHE